MKTKILVYGTGHFALKFVEECLNNKKAEVLAFVESRKSKESFCGVDVVSAYGGGINGYSYDLIIVISSYLAEIRQSLNDCQIDQEKCIFTTDMHNWLCNKKCVSLFINILNDGYIENEFKIIVEKQKKSSYGTAETYDGLAFIGNYADDIIGEMIDTGKVYSYDEVDTFFELSDKFYNVNLKGYFFDCGCNILTTAVYALSKRKELQAIGFEPVNRTWRIAKANAALNNLDERIQVINLALSDCKNVVQMRCSQYSSGGNYILSEGDDNSNNVIGLEEVGTIALDDWIEENNFDINKISYLWIDTEGYEGYVLKGMMKLLRRKKVPMYMEYYSDLLQRSGSKDVLLQCLEEIYSKYLVVKRGGDYDISRIHEMKELRNVQGMRENIFLIP